MEQEPGGEIPNIHPETLSEQPPTFLLDIYETATQLVASNGWYLLFACIAVVLIWSRAKPHVDKYLDDKAKREEDAMNKKNPELLRGRQLAVEVARQKMQMEHDRQAQLADEKRQKKEADRRAEKLERLSSVTVGNRLQSNATGKPEYSPLAGGAETSGFRPTRRPCPGGGCG